MKKIHNPAQIAKLFINLRRLRELAENILDSAELAFEIEHKDSCPPLMTDVWEVVLLEKVKEMIRISGGRLLSSYKSRLVREETSVNS